MRKKCMICGKQYTLGVDGIENGCDNCFGIERDAKGHFWLPEEKEHTYEDMETGKRFKVKRKDAFPQAA